MAARLLLPVIALLIGASDGLPPTTAIGMRAFREGEDRAHSPRKLKLARFLLVTIDRSTTGSSDEPLDSTSSPQG